MTIQDWGAIGEVGGGIAIIATLIYKESRFPSFACGENRLRSTACNGRTAPLVPLASLDSPNRGRRVACGSVLDSYMTLMESYYLHNRQYDEHLSQERWSRVLARILVTPGGAGYWRRRRTYFHEEFAEYIDGITGKSQQLAPNKILETDA